MKKKAMLLIGLILIPVLLLSSCGRNESGNSSSSASTASSKPSATVVKVWTEDRHDLEYVQDMIAKYNAENADNIQIELTVVSENYKNMIQLAYQSGDAPDVVGANNLPLNLYADTGILYPLNEFIDSTPEYSVVNEPETHMYEGLNTSNGNIYWLPSGMRSGVRVIYNKDLVEAAGYSEIPSSLNEYIEMAKTITEQGNGKYYGIGFTSSSPFERLLEMSAQVSGVFYYDYVNGKFDFSGYRPFLELGRRFIEENIAYPDQQQVDMMRAQFSVGSFALWSNASQEAAVFTSQIPVEGFEWAVAEVPSLTGEIKGALQVTPSKGYGIISSSKVKDAAWKVICYFQSEEFLKGYLEAGYNLPITTYMDGIIDKSKIGRLADFSLLSYESVYPQPPSVNITGDDYRTTLWNCIMGYVSIDDAINDLNTRYNTALDRDVKNGTVKRLVIKDYNPLYPNDGTFEYLSN